MELVYNAYLYPFSYFSSVQALGSVSCLRTGPDSLWREFRLAVYCLV